MAWPLWDAQFIYAECESPHLDPHLTSEAPYLLIKKHKKIYPGVCVVGLIEIASSLCKHIILGYSDTFIHLTL